MRLFDRRESVTIQDFCQDFYDAHVFFETSDSKYLPDPQGLTDVSKGFWSGVLERLFESDPVFEELDIGAFGLEWTALRLELFGLAWSHLFKHNTSIMLPQAAFTRSYLDAAGYPHIWDLMGDYSHAVTLSGDVQVAESKGFTGDRSQEAIVQNAHTVNNKARTELFDKLVASGADEECAIRIAKRIGTSPGWEKSLAVAPMCGHFTRRLGIQLEPPGHQTLHFTVRMIYEGTQSMTDKVKIVSQGKR
jgi:hypothetical protein